MTKLKTLVMLFTITTTLNTLINGKEIWELAGNAYESQSAARKFE